MEKQLRSNTMERHEKIEFVNDLMNCYKQLIVYKINSGKIPDTWDGIELRQYIIDTFKGCKLGEMSIKRKRDYKNTVFVNNL